MDNQEIVEILRLIAAKSDSIRGEAVKTIMALNNNSPIIQKRLNFVASNALRDSSVFTQDEINRITLLLNTEEGEARDYTLPIRLTQSEREELQRLAGDAGMTMSEYIRSRVF